MVKYFILATFAIRYNCPNQTWYFGQDAALETAVASHKINGWAAVAQHVGYSVTNTQCKNRWISYGKPLQDGLRSDSNWSKAEVCIYCFFLY